MALPALQGFLAKATPAIKALWLNSVDVATIQQADSGVANAYAVAMAPLSTQGQLVRFVPANTNTGASTLNGTAIIRTNGTALTGGEISALGAVVLQSTGTKWQIVSTAGAQPGYERTGIETTLSIIPVNYAYLPGVVDRYGTNTTPGTTDMTAAFQAAINQARLGGAEITWGATGVYVLTSPLDCTTAVGASGSAHGLVFRQRVGQATNLPPPVGSVQLGAIWVKHNGYAVFDLTGQTFFTFHDLSLVTNSSGSYPKCCFLTARNSDGESNLPRFYNTMVVGYFSVAVLYNYGSEDGIYVGNYWGNYASDAGAVVVALSANNYFKGSAAFMSSNFTTIAVGAQSTLSHNFYAGDLGLFTASTTGDVVYIEGGVGHANFYGVWMDCTNASTSGRSYVYNDTTNGPTNYLTLKNVQGENSATLPVNGVFFGAGSGVPTYICIEDCYIPTFAANITFTGAPSGTSATLNTNWAAQSGLYLVVFSDGETRVATLTNGATTCTWSVALTGSPTTAAVASGFVVGTGAGVIISTSQFRYIAEALTHGLNFPATLEDSTIDDETYINIGTALRCFIVGAAANITIATNTGTTILDRTTGSFILAGSSTGILKSTNAFANGSGAGTGTLTNAPASTNPTKWIPIDDAGVTRYIPAW